MNKYPEMIQNDISIKKVAYSKKRIASITKQGIDYIDESGEKFFIDFDICRKNWVIYVREGDEFGHKEITEAETTCVGWRNIIGHPPFIEFFTIPRTRFEFSQTLFDRIFRRRGLIRNFQAFQKAIWDAGWSTLDLS
jgi:hypothetical protein